ncbi:MAG: hypothetical protein V4479_11200 [Actinomycetota bacterium]
MEDLVPRFPVITVLIRENLTGELTVNGTSHPIGAESVERLRSGVIARCSRVAREIGRAVRLTVEEPEEHYELAIHPDAFVQVLSPAATIDAEPAERLVGTSTCRICGLEQSLRNNFCIGCGCESPHDIEGGRS